MLTLETLFESPDFVSLYNAYASRHTHGLRAHDVLGYGDSSHAELGQAIGNMLGVKAKARETVTLPLAEVSAARALVLALASQGIAPREIVADPDGQGSVISSAIADSWATFEGYCLARVLPLESECRIDVSMVFPGQMFDWGRGKRLLRGVTAALDGAVGAVNKLPV